MEAGEFESTNINSKWLENIYENIKNLENLERSAYEGCVSLLDYLQIPPETRHVIVGDAQYKNLKFMVTEIHLLLGDLTPVMKKERLKSFREQIEMIQNVISERYLFVKEPKNQDRTIKYSQVTPFFEKSLKFLSEIKIEIIKEISDILYVRAQEKTPTW